jgi:hypothetical protein
MFVSQAAAKPQTPLSDRLAQGIPVKNSPARPATRNTTAESAIDKIITATPRSTLRLLNFAPSSPVIFIGLLLLPLIVVFVSIDPVGWDRVISPLGLFEDPD